VSQVKSGNGQALVRASVAAILGTTAAIGYVPYSFAADAEPAVQADEVLEEVQVTGSRIVRKDMKSNSPLVTVDKQKLEDSSYISIEETLNDLPQFMAGGIGNGTGGNTAAATVTSLSAATGANGGNGSGDMFNMSLLPDNTGTVGLVVPGAANVNMRGLGANRSLVLIDGHRAMPLNASLAVDMNTIPSIAIGSLEIVTGGASAVYGADALAGVTNIKFRDNFEGMKVNLKTGINEVGDGEELQLGTLIGGRFGSEKGHAMVGLEYSKRHESLWSNRGFLRDVMESEYSNAGDFLFGWDPEYRPSTNATGGAPNSLQTYWSGNAPADATVLSVFSDRQCGPLVAGVAPNCITIAPGVPYGAPGLSNGAYMFNPDGTLYVRQSQTGAGASSRYFGPQSYTQSLANPGTEANPNEISCNFGAPSAAGVGFGTYQGTDPRFTGKSCSPTINRVDYGRWLTLPREAYTAFGRATFDFNDHLTGFTNFHFASSNTETRREPAPFLGGGFNANIPFHTSQGGDVKYLPSLVTAPGGGFNIGDTLPEYRVGGTKGTNCAPTGGCTMAQAFPLQGDVLAANGTVTTPGELRRLLESRASSTLTATTGGNAPFRGLSACQQYILTSPGAPGSTVNPTTGASYVIKLDSATGLPLQSCGANAPWALGAQLPWLPPRGTRNTERLFQFELGLRGDLGLSDWTWEAYVSHGDSQTQVAYDGFTSYVMFNKLMSAPNYGRGYAETGVSSKYVTCTSGINPFDRNLVVSQDCIDAVSSNQIDRNSMTQRVYEATAQGHVADLPAGEVRGAVGATYRRNAYQYTPDSLRERDYVGDTSAGQFASGAVDAAVNVKEAYGELLVPILRDLPGVNTLDAELGYRFSKYSTGQEVDTYKVLLSWEPIDWVRVRGGYNRAERAPNMSELFATATGNSNLLGGAVDPCVFANTSALAIWNGPGTPVPVRTQLLALCNAQINAWGGNNGSEFSTTYNPSDPTTSTWVPSRAPASLLLQGNPRLRNEQGDTWTIGLALRAPFEHALLRRTTATVDWYEVRIKDPIEVVSSTQIVNSCFNVNGVNPTFALNDPNGYCALIERSPLSGGIERIFNSYTNQGKFVIRGIDTTLNWSAALTDMGMGDAPGMFSVNLAANFLFDQIQRYGVGAFGDYAGYGGASKLRGNTTFAYNWDKNRVSLNWQYRLGTLPPTGFAATAAADGSTSPTLKRNPVLAGYHTNNMFALTAGRRMGGMNVSLSINNLLNTKPKAAGYDFRDPLQGYGSFNPYDDLVGRRYSLNMSMEF
jgi:iron complex outermembrane recepter protein